jgi:UDP-N-acetylmuramoylalanine--D-glutamate ligase
MAIHPGEHFLVVGLGLSGLAAVRFLLLHGARVSVSEATLLEQINPATRNWLAEQNVLLESGGHTKQLFLRADRILVSPGVPLNLPELAAARQRHIPVIGEMAVAAHYLHTPSVAITGTNGKTTVTTLLGELCRAASYRVFVGGNIGTPMLEYLAGPQDCDMAVVEMSSYQIDTAGGVNGFKPEVALLLNITPDHLDRYDAMADYIASKFAIFAAQSGKDAAIVNTDDPLIMAHRHLWPRSRLFGFGNNRAGLPGARIRDGKVYLTGLSQDISTLEETAECYDLSTTALALTPNLQNGAAAILAARLMGCPAATIARGLAAFAPLAHRLTVVATIDGITFIDDSKATNIGAVQAALDGINRPVVLIAGGRDKGGDYTLLADAIRKKVKGMVLLGEAREKMARAFRHLTAIEEADTMQHAVQRAKAIAASGDVVLLSPACSSFDMFPNYARRGDAFTEAVKELLSGRPSRRGAKP